MNFLSVCSGIEAATQAFAPLGWKAVAFSEIEPFPCAVLAHHYPDVPNWGDMTNFKEWPDANVDVLCGGTPCQDYSIAGLRAGMDAPRGNLTLTFGLIAARYRPRWILWENVPGVLSSNRGRDFARFLGLLAGRDIAAPKDGWKNSGIIPGIGSAYGLAFRVLDAQHVRTRRFPHAVPQRRRRVFVVGYLGDWRRAAAVLFDRESLSGHPAPRREAGKGFTHGVAPSLVSSGRGVDRAGDTRGQDPMVAVYADFAPTLNAAFGDKQGLEDQHINGGGACSLPPVSHCLNAGGMGRIDYESETFIPMTGGGFDVAHALRGEGFDALEDGTGRGTPIVPVAFTTEQTPKASENCALTLTKQSPTGGGQIQSVAIPVAIQERAICENPNAGSDGAGVKQDGSSYTLEARTVPQAVAFDLRGREGGAMPEGPHDTANIRAASGESSRSYVAQPWAVRRLTPTECERLQGFPDNFTRIPYRGKPADKCPDGPRYKALGNSWAVNCADWIGERIAEVDAWT